MDRRMQKTSFPCENLLKLEDINEDKAALNQPQDNQEKQKCEQDQPPRHRTLSDISLRSRTMSDPRDYFGQAEKDRCPECTMPHRLCKRRAKHTHFANSRQIAQSIYPDFLSSLPDDHENPSELKKKVRALLIENEKTKSPEAVVDAPSKGPSKKSLISWYRREYGLSFDEAKANIS